MAVVDTEAKFKRVKLVRETMEGIKEKRSKLSGEIDGNKKRLAELEKECKEKYDVDIKKLPELIKQLDTEAEEAITKAEGLLQIQ